MKKIYIAYSDDDVLPLKQVKEEYKAMKSRFYAQEHLMELDFGASRENIVNRIKNLSSSLEIFSYSGHANQGAIITEEEATRAEGLAILLGQCPNLKLVLLNGCATAGQVELLKKQGIPIIIATSAEVNDYLAKVFALALFDALLLGKTIKEAFELAKGTVCTVENRGDIQFSYRGLDLSEVSANQWEISFREETLLNGTLDSITAFRKPLYEYATKLLFIGDSEDGKDFYLRVKSAFDQEEKKGNYILEDIWGNGNQMNAANVIDKIAATDVIICLVNGLKFVQFWKSIAPIVQAIKENPKPIPWILANINGVDTSVEVITEKIGPHSAIVPDYFQILEDLADAKLDGFIERTFKNELMREATRIIEGNISHEKLLEELAEFDLSAPTEAFRLLVKQQKQYHLIMIEGTNQCGQDLLLRRLRGYLPSPNLVPIYFQSQLGTITKVEQLFEKIAAYLELPVDTDIDYIVSTMSQKLKAKQIAFVFDNVIDVEMEEEIVKGNLEILSQCWKILTDSLPKSPNPQLKGLYIFAVNRDLGDQKKFLPLPSTNPLAIAEALPIIERVESGQVCHWFEEKRPKFQESRFEKIEMRVEEITGDGFLDGVLKRLCYVIECKKVYATIKNRL